jgi:hypothetical protein
MGDAPFKRSASVDSTPLHEELNKRIAFQEYLESINTIPDDEYFASQMSVEGEGAVEPNVKVLLYFIGRLNPPHPGHIDVLIELIELAKKEYEIAGKKLKTIKQTHKNQKQKPI